MFFVMSHVLAAVTACVLALCTSTAVADVVDDNVHQLQNDPNRRARLSAALLLSRSRDARAVSAVAGALRNDAESIIRRVSALALEKMIDERTPPWARARGINALDQAAAGDSDQRVRDSAAKALRSLSGLRTERGPSDKSRAAGLLPSGDELFGVLRARWPSVVIERAQ